MTLSVHGSYRLMRSLMTSCQCCPTKIVTSFDPFAVSSGTKRIELYVRQQQADYQDVNSHIRAQLPFLSHSTIRIAKVNATRKGSNGKVKLVKGPGPFFFHLAVFSVSIQQQPAHIQFCFVIFFSAFEYALKGPFVSLNVSGGKFSGILAKSSVYEYGKFWN